MPTVTLAGYSKKGENRYLNQDSFMLRQFPSVNDESCAHINLLAVFDGLGENEASVLSQQAMAAFCQSIADNLTKQPLPNVLNNAIENVNSFLFQQAQESSGWPFGGGICAALMAGDSAYLAWVMNCRAYLIRNKQLTLLTRDIDITNWCTVAPTLEYYVAPAIFLHGLGNQAEIYPLLGQVQLAPADILLFCTDGLWKALTEPAILARTMQAPSLVASCQDLCEAAHAHDDVTVVMAQVQDLAADLPQQPVAAPQWELLRGFPFCLAGASEATITAFFRFYLLTADFAYAQLLLRSLPDTEVKLRLATALDQTRVINNCTACPANT